MKVAGPNAEQIRYWNDAGSQRWVRQQSLLDDMLGPLGRRALGRAAVQPGEQAIDVGCGCGDTSLALATLVGSHGSVTGVDVSAPMLARARERASAARVANIHFVEADAQSFAFAGSADVVFSRFGVMFFVDPVAAFRNLHAALAPGGRLAFVCWQGLVQNPWMHVPLSAVAGVIPLPSPPPPGAPGPFAFADAARVRGILERAGFADVEIAPCEDSVVLGADAAGEGAVELLLDTGPVAAALREATPDTRPRVAEAVRQALVPYATAAGPRLGAAVWLVTARAG